MRAYEYRHVVGFEETNLVGTVYYTNYLSWQGRCRELFLREHVPTLLEDLRRGLRLLTTHCSCEFLRELGAFDEVIVRMRLAELEQNRIELDFEYVTPEDAVVARGKQGVACMRQEGERLEATPIPRALRDALVDYMGV